MQLAVGARVSANTAIGNKGTSGRLGALSPRVLLVLQLSARGYTADQIATLLTIQADFVSEALATIGEWLRTGDDRHAAVRVARARGLIV